MDRPQTEMPTVDGMNNFELNQGQSPCIALPSNCPNGVSGESICINIPGEQATVCYPAPLPRATLLQKVVAEVIGTFILVFTGCGSAMVDTRHANSITHLGVSIAFGLVVMVMVYSIGHISGAHMNPAVTIAFAAVKHFPWKEVPAYIAAEVVGSIIASYALRVIVGPVAHVGATIPAGSDLQSFFLEIIITYILMFVVSAVSCDSRAIGELAGLAVGAVVGLNAIMAGPISGASMNPARSLGPAIVSNHYHSLWVYIVAPLIGALTGAFSYSIIKLPSKLANQVQRPKSFKRETV